MNPLTESRASGPTAHPYRRSESGPVHRLFRTAWILLVLLAGALTLAHFSFVQETAERERAFESAIPVLISGLLLAALFSLLLWWQAAKSSRRIEHLVGRIRHVAEAPPASLEHVLVSSHDELGEIAYHVNALLDRYRGMIRNATELVEQAAGSGSDLNATQTRALSLARKQFEESSGLSAGLDELERSVKRAARNLSEACKRSLTNTEMVKDSGEKMGVSREGTERVLKGMERVQRLLEQLHMRSGEIGEVIQIILGITAQTQLVSLNAAIEAARAGPAGEGFAVVADEISKLAQNSGRAAEQVTQLLETIRDEAAGASGQIGQIHRIAEENRAQTHRAWERLQEIVTDARQALENLSEITSSAELQSVTSENLAASFDQIVEIMEQNCQSAVEAVRVQEHLTGKLSELQATLRSRNGT